MSSKNRGFAAGLVGAVETAEAPRGLAERGGERLGVGTLAGRSNRLAELASGALVSRAQELVDPGRCRMWPEHNRDYGALTETSCADLIESLKAQGKQEVPAIVRRLQGDADHDFEVICGARRHWSVSWLRAHNYPDFRFLVEVRELTDEEAFRVSDLENRARADLTDLERARDYLRALERHYEGRQKSMAQRLNVTESWLSRYLDLARLPASLVRAFPDPHDLKIKHVTLLKPLLKPEDRLQRVLDEAQRIADGLANGALSLAAPQDVIRRLTQAADAPKRSGAPKKSGKVSPEIIAAPSGRGVIRLDGRKRNELAMTLLLAGGTSREEIVEAFGVILARCFPG
jgi:ParB family chromosome partitioning protein